MKQLLTTTLFEEINLSSGDKVYVSNTLPLSGTIVNAGSAKKVIIIMQLANCTIGNTITLEVSPQYSTTHYRAGVSESHTVPSLGGILFHVEISYGSVPEGNTIGLNISIQSDLASAETSSATASIGIFDMTPFDSDGRVDVGTVRGELPLSENDFASAIIQGEDPSTGDAYPIFVDSNGRIEISGTNNTLDDIANTSGEVSLSSTGLDSILPDEPIGRATTFREMVVQLWMRFFNRVERTPSSISVYNDADDTAITTQNYESGTTTKVEKS